MDSVKGFAISDEDRLKFRNYVGGCIPDLVEACGGELESSLGEFRYAISDFVGDRVYDTFPDLNSEAREEVKEWVCNYFCGHMSFPVENPNALNGKRRGGK